MSLWEKESGIINGEPGMFFGENPVRLLFPAEKILRVSCPALGTVYREGADFTHEPGSDLLFRTSGSAIPVLPECAIHPDPETAIVYPGEGANAVSNGPEKELLLFDNRSFFAEHQALIDYRTVCRDYPVLPRLLPGQLPRFRKGLQEKKSLSVTLIGDSISEGFNASAYIGIPPYSPAYIDQFARILSERSGAEISVKNAAVEGTCCEHALENRDFWLNEPCDLLVIAYGMNDFSRTPANRFTEILNEIIRQKSASHPETEFLLIASMSGHPEWRYTLPGPDQLFAEALKKMSSDSVGVADVYTLWQYLLRRKSFYDLTGNGVNHPNDYGHSVYATVLSALFE